MEHDKLDGHLFFQWVTGDNGVKYTHYEVLVPTSTNEVANIHLPPTACRFKIQGKKGFFDPETYAGKTYQFPKLAGRLRPDPSTSSFMRPMCASQMTGFFEQSSYEGKNFEFQPLQGKIAGTQGVRKEDLLSFFGVPTDQQVDETNGDQQVQDMDQHVYIHIICMYIYICFVF